MYYTHDIETSTLQIRTNVATGSGEKIVVVFHTRDNKHSGSIFLMFSDPPTYRIEACQQDWTRFSVKLPSERDKIWSIIETATSLTLVCNNIYVLKFNFHHSPDSRCLPSWGKDTEKIFFDFDSDVTGSVHFRAKPENVKLGNVIIQT